jgi:hypothetical protein
MTGDPEGLGRYGMVTPLGGDCRTHKREWVQFNNCFQKLFVELSKRYYYQREWKGNFLMKKMYIYDELNR